MTTIYLVTYEDYINDISGVYEVFDSKTKALQYILKEYPGCIYDEEWDCYNIQSEHCDLSINIEEWEVK